MPELDGVNATKKLREQGVTIPILALSAHVLTEERKKIIKSGVTDVLTKPLTQERLVAFIKNNCFQGSNIDKSSLV